MATDVDPIVGSWYQLPDKSQPFEVISLDEDIGLVEIQYLDGDQEELELDTWYELDVEPTDAPEEWIGSIDDLERDGRYAGTQGCSMLLKRFILGAFQTIGYTDAVADVSRRDS